MEEREKNYSFGIWIKNRRKALDLTQKQLAQQVGCSPSLIFKIESDERRPSREIAELLARHLEIPLEQQELFLRVARQEKWVEGLENVPSISTPKPIVSAAANGLQLSGNLPVSITSLIGREHEVQAVVQQIHHPECRLLTLTGPGGVGKTRLALEIAHKLHPEFKYGACFSSLVGTSASEFIVPAIAESLGFIFSGTTELKVQLFNYLKEKHILLVLDNLEHLLEGIELLDELLTSAPHVKLLTTSREQLNLRPEWVFEVQGLPVPSTIEADQSEANSAIALFIQRAKQANVNLTPILEDLSAIQRICQLVDGLPLGLELAASWMRTLSPQEIAVEIENNMDFLTASARDIPQRHRSIRAVFEHSWKLLSEQERQVMRRLTVFRGGFTREAAGQVASATLPLLSALVDKSLLRRSGPRRFDLHELIRQFAASHLKENLEEERATQKQHVDYFLTLLQKDEVKLRSALQTKTLAELTMEIDNIRAAWEFAIRNQWIDLLRRAIGPLHYFYELHQYFNEVERHLRDGAMMVQGQIESLYHQAEESERAKLHGALGEMLTHQAFFLGRMGYNREGLSLYRESFRLLKPIHEPYALTYTYVFYGILCWVTGDLQEAFNSFTEGLPLSRTLPHPWLEAIGLCFLGATTHDMGDYEKAYEIFSEAIKICQQMQDPYITLLISTVFSRTAQVQERLALAHDLLRENLQIARDSGNRWGIGLGLEQLGGVEYATGNYEIALKMLGESVAIYHEIGDPWSLSRVLNLMTKLTLSHDIDLAESSALQAYKVAAEFEFNLNAMVALAMLAVIRTHQGKNETAYELALFVLEHAASPHEEKKRVGELLTQLDKQMTAQQIEAAYSRVQSMTLKNLIRELTIP